MTVGSRPAKLLLLLLLLLCNRQFSVVISRLPVVCRLCHLPQPLRHTDKHVGLYNFARLANLPGKLHMYVLLVGPILWGHSGPICHALSLSLLLL